jgi:hypothetical protein
MPVTAVRHLRKMRGGAQSHLLEADDGYWYVVKFRNNPQHRRILVNELLASAMLDYLKIAIPETALIRVTPEFLEACPELSFTFGTRTAPVESGWHFGSRYPGDPARTAVYDFLPDALLHKVANLADFRAVLVFDKWAANADGRQSVFYRALVRGGASPSPAFVVLMIDHGFAFDGPNWDLPESAPQGLYARHMVYEPVRSLEDFEPWLKLVNHFPEEVIDRAWKATPPEWIEGDEDALQRLLERLFERRKRVAALVEACRTMRSSPFPNWS